MFYLWFWAKMLGNHWYHSWWNSFCSWFWSQNLFDRYFISSRCSSPQSRPSCNVPVDHRADEGSRKLDFYGPSGVLLSLGASPHIFFEPLKTQKFAITLSTWGLEANAASSYKAHEVLGLSTFSHIVTLCKVVEEYHSFTQQSCAKENGWHLLSTYYIPDSLWESCVSSSHKMFLVTVWQKLLTFIHAFIHLSRMQ